MKPYPRAVLSLKERVFNYRLSRARQIIENTFGIAAARFRIFRRPIIAGVETATRATKAVVGLHNFLMKGRTFNDKYCPKDFVYTADRPGDWRKEADGNIGLIDATNLGSNNYSGDAKMIRQNFRDYFCSEEGSVSWQWKSVNHELYE